MRVLKNSLPVIWTLALSLSISAWAQTKVEPGFNLFSAEQDVEIGKQSAAEVEKQYPILRDASIENYIGRIGQRLDRVAPGPDFPYQFKVVNLSDVNAFALPGGFMYVNRGLIEAAESEAELAGVLAHEMAHIALRHGTNQASKAYLAQAGLGILGGLLGGGGATSQIISAIGGFGLNAVFLKFSRDAEEQADIVGAQMLARAGYNPLAMADFFKALEENMGRNPGAVEEFFSSHPSPGNRAARVSQEAQLLDAPRDSHEIGGFRSVQAELSQMPAAPSSRQLASGEAPAPDRPAEAGIASPSDTFRTFRQRDGFFEISYPENWQVFESDQGLGVTIAPQGGVVRQEGGKQDLIYSVIINHYEPFEGSVGGSFGRSEGPFSGQGYLERAANDLVHNILQSNRYLTAVPRSARYERLQGDQALSVMLSGRSPVTGQEERILLMARDLRDNHLLYILFVAPGPDFTRLAGTFERMLKSLRVYDRAVHRN